MKTDVEANRRHRTPVQHSSTSSKVEFELSSSQLKTYECLVKAIGVSPVVGLVGSPGAGRTSILKKLAALHGGVLIGMSDLAIAAQHQPGNKWEEAFDNMVMECFQHFDLIIIDDYTSLTEVSFWSYTRGSFLKQVVSRRLSEAAKAAGKCLVLVGMPLRPWESAADLFGDQAALVSVSAFTSIDYAEIVGAVLGANRIQGVDFNLIYRYAAVLHCYQLTLAAHLLAKENEITTDSFIECLETYVLHSNTRTDEVELLSFDSLPGSEHIVEQLETNIVLPFENRTLARELGLKPKRGVLLYGPPGTGKTSIGRALAHRMKGKFFLIDGSFLSEPPNAFFEKVQRVVEDAKANSPSVLFIDDADVLFKIEHITGLVRYLLSLLDGLESETASNVCVMMTAMDVRKIPDALLRSGRVELWLETKAPDAVTRARILQRWMGTELPDWESIDYPYMAQAAPGFTPADLRRIAGDAKTLYAADIVGKHPIRTANDYISAAINDVIAVRSRMADMLGDNSMGAGVRA